MKKRKKIKQSESIIRRLLLEGDGLSPAKRAWNRLTEFFSTIDELESSNHSNIIRYLYRRPASAKETMVYIAWKYSMSERTLYRYRQKYVECFFMYYHKELENA